MKQQEKKPKRVQHTDKKVNESLSYTVEVRDKEGRILERISAPSHSYVQQWNQILNVQASQETKTVKDTDGNNQTPVAGGSSLGAKAAIGYILCGLRVGKGTTAVAIDDYAIETPLDEGTGTDEFEHQLQEFTSPAVADSTCSFALIRTLINNSGATISGIREIGCYVRMHASYYALGFRDVLPAAVNVPDGGSITVTYTVSVTV